MPKGYRRPEIKLNREGAKALSHKQQRKMKMITAKEQNERAFEFIYELINEASHGERTKERITEIIYRAGLLATKFHAEDKKTLSHN